MPRLIITPQAVSGIDRCYEFLAAKSPDAADRAGAAILAKLLRLEATPQMGRPLADGLRELVIPFGDAGYIALYRFVPREDAVLVLALRHQREVNYN